MTEYKHVFSPLKFGNIEVKNRIEVPPMLSCLATPDGYVTPELIEFYRSMAKGGAGIVTVGDTAIDAEYARGHFSQMHLGDDSVITGLYALVEAIQRYGAKASIEINHSGRLVSQKLLKGKSPIGPSPITSAREELNAAKEGKEVIVAGAGLTGCETALHIARKGGTVTVIDIITENEIAKDTNLPNKIVLMDLMDKNNIKVITEVKLDEVTDKGIIIVDKNRHRLEIDAETVVLALGVKACSDEVREFTGLAPETFAIDDCSRPRDLMGAIHDAFNTAMEI